LLERLSTRCARKVFVSHCSGRHSRCARA
jgi:hypothetical protein